MKLINIKPTKHVIVCINEREIDSCCKKVGGEEIYYKLKEFVKNNNLIGKVWITRAKCLGFCNDIGATIVIYPECKWFKEVKEEDLDNILKCL